MIRLTALDGRPRLTEEALPLPPILRDAMAARPEGPVVVMVHGYKYATGLAHHCPFETIYATRPEHRHLDPKIVSWPRHLGLTRPGAGLAIGLSWQARGSIRRAYAHAAQAGAALAEICAEVRALAPGRPIHLFGHSLGARVILEGFRQGPASMADGAILLAPAEFHAAAARALRAPGARGCRTLCVTSRENDLFDVLMLASVGGMRMIGAGGVDAPGAATLRIDRDEARAGLRRLGCPIAAPRHRICHWSPYLRPGLFRLYRALQQGTLGFDRLAAHLPQERAFDPLAALRSALRAAPSPRSARAQA